MYGLLTVLPFVLVMIAGPQIVSAVFLATSVNWARNSLAYIAGASLSITAIVTITYFIVRGARAAQHRSRATRESRST